MIIGKLLASAPARKKQFTKAISKDQAIWYRVSLVNIYNALYINNCWYFMSSSKVKIRLQDGSKVRPLWNTGARINVMTREMIEDAGLAMKKAPSLSLCFTSVIVDYF